MIKINADDGQGSLKLLMQIVHKDDPLCQTEFKESELSLLRNSEECRDTGVLRTIVLADIPGKVPRPYARNHDIIASAHHHNHHHIITSSQSSSHHHHITTSSQSSQSSSHHTIRQFYLLCLSQKVCGVVLDKLFSLMMC
jgi:hypothetical protein